MTTLLPILHIFSAVFLVIFVLLHTAKGEGLGGIGGQARLFGTQKGLEEGLNRITTIFATSFMVLSFLLAFLLR